MFKRTGRLTHIMTFGLTAHGYPERFAAVIYAWLVEYLARLCIGQSRQDLTPVTHSSRPTCFRCNWFFALSRYLLRGIAGPVCFECLLPSRLHKVESGTWSTIPTHCLHIVLPIRFNPRLKFQHVANMSSRISTLS